mmetsp:Transcript_10803/g.25268  ORF Transcript_10803/g.25268 Transcript_10803/m.25268 type:complete len:230 (-) Transcript_10803:917-1606(-)
MKSSRSMNTDPLKGNCRGAKNPAASDPAASDPAAAAAPPRSVKRGWEGTSKVSTSPSGQLVIVSFTGSSTPKARGASSSRASRAQSSSTDMSMLFSALLIPTRSQKSRSASAGMPRRRSPEMVGMRGSSHPWTWPSWTRPMSFRFDKTVYCRFSRENSICRGLTTSSGALPLLGLAVSPSPNPSKRPDGATAPMAQSYKGRWSANSRVHREWVIPSRASESAWAKSYMG